MRGLIRRWRLRLSRCPADCGAAEPPAVYRDRSFAEGLESPDQAEIVATLAERVGPTTRILHVGVGSSALARRLAPSVAGIDGMTVLDDERAAAQACGFANYRVWLGNKYGGGLAPMAPPYDVVVDNNPGSFACCVRHFRGMMGAYATGLGEGGAVWTHERGAAWRQRGGLLLRWDGWAREAARAGLEAERVTRDVWLARRPLGG